MCVSACRTTTVRDRRNPRSHDHHFAIIRVSPLLTTVSKGSLLRTRTDTSALTDTIHIETLGAGLSACVME